MVIYSTVSLNNSRGIRSAFILCIFSALDDQFPLVEVDVAYVQLTGFSNSQAQIRPILKKVPNFSFCASEEALQLRFGKTLVQGAVFGIFGSCKALHVRAVKY